jgi:hypothetical protein
VIATIGTPDNLTAKDKAKIKYLLEKGYLDDPEGLSLTDKGIQVLEEWENDGGSTERTRADWAYGSDGLGEVEFPRVAIP